MSWPPEEHEAAKAAAKGQGLSFRAWLLAAAKLAQQHPASLARLVVRVERVERENE
jgi:hypothetical protein